VYLWVGVAIGIYVRAQVCKPGYCLYCSIVNMDCSWSNSSSNILDLRLMSFNDLRLVSECYLFISLLCFFLLQLLDYALLSASLYFSKRGAY